MISKASNKSFARHNYMCGLRTKTKFAVIILILHLFAAPAVTIAAIAAVYSRDIGFDLCEAMAMIGAVTTSIAGLLGIYLAIDSFACLHNRSVVDMRFALPLNAKQRFLSNYLSGLTVYLAPFYAAQVISLLAMGYGCIFMDGRTFQRHIGSDPDTGAPLYIDYVCQYFGSFMTVLLKLILCGTLVMIMLYTLTVLVTVCCGSKFESIGSSLLINAAVPLTIFCVFRSMFSGLFGIGSEGEKITLRAIMCTSPAGGILATAQWISHGIFVEEAEVKLAEWLSVFILLTAAMFGGAYFLYVKRRAQHTGRPFVFRFIYYLISTAAVFCITALFDRDEQSIVVTVIVTFLVYLILECIVRRGFRRIWVGIIRYTGIIFVSIMLIKTAHATEGFGMVERVPDISSVKSVELDYSGFYGYFHLPYVKIYEDEYYYERNERTLLFTEKENIETIIAAHQRRVDNRELDGLYRTSGEIKIKYHLTGGRELIRTYNGFTADELEILSRLDLTNEYKTQVAEAFRECLNDVPLDYMKYSEFFSNYDYYEYSNMNYLFVENNNGVMYRLYKHDNATKVNTYWLIQKNFFEQLAEAYAADIMNISEENYYNNSALNEEYIIYMSVSRMTYGLRIPGSFEKTIELMDYFGFIFDKKEDVPDDELTNVMQKMADNDASVRIYTADEWRSFYNVPAGTRLHGSYSINHSEPRNFIKDIDDDVITLYKSAEPMNILPESGYIIYVSGDTGVIPEELNGIAEMVYEGSYGDADGHGNPFWLVSEKY